METNHKKRRTDEEESAQTSSGGRSTFASPGKAYVPVVASTRNGNDLCATTIGIFCSPLTAIRASIQYLLENELISITDSGCLKKYGEDGGEEDVEGSEEDGNENDGEELTPIDKFMKEMASHLSERQARTMIRHAVREVNISLPARGEWDCDSYDFDIRCHDVNDSCDPAEGVILM